MFSALGMTSELKVAAALAANGHMISFPITSETKYDLIADLDGDLLRIQVKVGHYKDGIVKAVLARSCSDVKKYNKNSVDGFAIYCPELETCYMVPIDDWPNRKCLHIQVGAILNGATYKHTPLDGDQYKILKPNNV